MEAMNIFNSKESVIEKVKGISAAALAEQYSKSELSSMYQILYVIQPNPRKTKLDIAYEIRDFVENDIRTKDLCKILDVGRLRS